MKIFMIRDQDNNPIKTYKNTWCYKTLGTAKSAAKSIIKHKNKKLDKNSKLSFQYLKIIECELVIKETHPL